MNLDFLCLTKRDLENQRFDSLCRNSAGSPNFYLAQTCHPRVWYCSRSFRPELVVLWKLCAQKYIQNLVTSSANCVT